MQNAGKLAGRTIFISGASRGIGKAIALKCAKDGANIVIAAKTATPHPKLPGTIYTAAEEIEAAGGKCLPCIVDIRHEDQVQEAIKNTVDRFGGIDVLINNASAISLTGTESLPMKTFDLMMGVNARGTYLCSKYAVPHLKKGTNPHILNISPPLNMNPMWFSGHVAYTMAKYGMSMCVLGMAREFADEGIAVNALWPKTAIYTAAMEMLGGGGEIKSQCRTPDIMCDAAHAILCKTSKQLTGQFLIDEDVLRNEGVTDFDHYKCVPDGKLLPDFFLDEGLDVFREQMEAAGGTPGFAATGNNPGGNPGSGSGGSPQLQQTFQDIQGLLNEETVQSINGVYSFDLKDDGKWFLDLKTGAGSAGPGDPSIDANCTFTMGADDFVKMFAGKLNPTSAFMTGKMKIKGDLSFAMKLEKLMKQAAKSKL